MIQETLHVELKYIAEVCQQILMLDLSAPCKVEKVHCS